jgi:hypothetical protein
MRFAQQVNVNVMGQRGQHGSRHPLHHFRYPLKLL